ncbi:MAG: hypothetical protein A2X84_05825 [Desulfuromonadaceae bacterium GWC2_58_13]|nr:MAG: hypothetical protein A2X84_05825 [Desulfuromonadaceae bacterium GWC2_58_13]
MPEDIDRRLKRLGPKLESLNIVVFAYLFGGLARGQRRPLSDVDIAVYLRDTDFKGECSDFPMG